jgi:hypothetical protein
MVLFRRFGLRAAGFPARKELQGDWVWRLTRWISAIKKLGIDKLSFRPTPLGSGRGEACAATLSHNLKFSNTIVNRHN